MWEISIHAPREGGDDNRLPVIAGDQIISIHAPREGGDSGRLGAQRPPVYNFNPRPPRGGRLCFQVWIWRQCEFQSTPPARGATYCICNISLRRVYFNPRPPRGGRLRYSLQGALHRHFNPRPPRGGRRKLTGRGSIPSVISIHAPREGGDMAVSSTSSRRWWIFQSTPPARGATVGTTTFKLDMFISIHAPREGGDSKDAQFYLRIFDKQVELLRFLGKIRGWLPEKPGERPAFSREKPCEPPDNYWSLGLRGGREGASRIPMRRTAAAPGGVCQRIRGSSGR